MQNKNENIRIGGVHESIREIITGARGRVYRAANSAMVEAYWQVGKQIVEAQSGEARAEYGTGLIDSLAPMLTEEFGRGFTALNLHLMRKFYLTFPNFYALRKELSWTHYRRLIRVDDEHRRDFYLQECIEQSWSTRLLDRQINTHYYERLLAAHDEARDKVRNEVQVLEPLTEQDTIINRTVMLDFLDIRDRANYLESELEQALIDKLQEFLLELGKGFAFVARQRRISSGDKSYYIDLVLYNYILKCFVLVDLKVGSLTHQDIGQIDFYRRIYDDKVRRDDDNPTVGIVLSSSGDANIVRYSVMADVGELHSARYKLYLPSEEELQAELVRERQEIEALRIIDEGRGRV
ncbi:MAG: PDDEXK nuclease domain-containing protein [Coriobacteriia bacterium]|nr:PDDEXK nuclease domain-containing protein [Coriobacteriia bacterium]MCL2536765.1 PDDEXK nuclease domain-containing protein [Coriobacteriia bacterium]